MKINYIEGFFNNIEHRQEHRYIVLGRFTPKIKIYRQWCEEHCSDGFIVATVAAGFVSETDALLFTLKWSAEIEHDTERWKRLFN